MTFTARIIHLIDKLKIENLFIEEDKKIIVRLISFNPKKFEKVLDQIFASNGKFYHMNELEKEIMRELEYRNTMVH